MGEPGLDPQTQREVDYRLRIAERQAIRREQKITALLAQAAQQVKDAKRFEPEGANALATYQAVLQLEPNNAKARQGLQAIAAHQEAVARRAAAAGDWEKALAAIRQGRQAVPDHQGLVALEAKVHRAIREQAAREKRIANLLEQAKAQLEAGRYTTPAGDNAYETDKEVLGIEPDHEAARRDIQHLALIQKGLAVVSDHADLQALQQAVEKDQAAQALAALLAKAEEQLAKDQLTAPPGDNAYESF